MKSARIAQMESSRFVGGSAESQDLLRAQMTSRSAATGGSSTDRLSREATRSATEFLPRASCSPSNLPASPPEFSSSGIALLKRGYVAQALIDCTAVLFCFLFILATAMSIPLALFLMLFASF